MSTLKNDNFGYLSDDLFQDDEEENELNITKIENKPSTQSSSDDSSTYVSQRYEEKKRLLEIYMADPSIPASQKNGRCFLLSLYNPQYTTQKIYKLRKRLKPIENIQKLEKLKKQQNLHRTDDFGYDKTFFATKEFLIDQYRRLENIPKPIKEIYQTKGIVPASQIYKLEQNLHCDYSDDSKKENDQVPGTSGIKNVPVANDVHEINKSLLELSRTVSEQHEISQILKELENIDELDTSLNELTQKLQSSTKAAELIDHTISTSQRLKILNEIYTMDLSVNTCDLFSDDDEPMKVLESNNELAQTDSKPDISSTSTNKNETPAINSSNNSHYNNPIDIKIPTEVKFSFASGKNVAISSSSIMKFKSIFDVEEKKLANEINVSDESAGTSRDFIHPPPTNFTAGFVFASGKTLNVNNSKLEAFERKFKDEEEKLKKIEVEDQQKVMNENREVFDSCPKVHNESQQIANQNVLNKSQKVHNCYHKPHNYQCASSNFQQVLYNNSKVLNNHQKVQNNCGFAFASGKTATVSAAKFQNFEKKFLEEDKKQLEVQKSPEPKPTTNDFMESQFFMNTMELNELEKIENEFLNAGNQVKPSFVDGLKSCGTGSLKKSFTVQDQIRLANVDLKKPKSSSNVAKEEFYNDSEIDEWYRRRKNKSRTVFQRKPKNGKLSDNQKSICSRSSGFETLKDRFAALNDVSTASKDVTTASKDVSTASRDVSSASNYEFLLDSKTKLISSENELEPSKNVLTTLQDKPMTSNDSSMILNDVATTSKNSSASSLYSSHSRVNVDYAHSLTNLTNSSENNKKYPGNLAKLTERFSQNPNKRTIIERKNVTFGENTSINLHKIGMNPQNDALSESQKRKVQIVTSNLHKSAVDPQKNAENSQKTTKNLQKTTKNPQAPPVSPQKFISSHQKETILAQKRSLSPLRKPLNSQNCLQSNSIFIEVPSTSISSGKQLESTSRKLSVMEISADDSSKLPDEQLHMQKCAFVFASGKNLSINQLKVDNFKRKFEMAEDEDRNKASSGSIEGILEVNNEVNNNTTVTPPASKKPRNSDLNLSSYRMNSKRPRKMHAGDSDIFNFTTTRDTSQRSQHDKSAVDINAPATARPIPVDSDTKEQVKKTESPQKPALSKKSMLFAPSFTSSPLVRQSKVAKTNENSFDALREKFKVHSVPKKLSTDLSMHDDDDDDFLIRKPMPGKRKALHNDTFISPIVKRQKVSRPSKPVRRSMRLHFDSQTTSQRLAELDEFLALQSQLCLFANDPTASQFKNILDFEQKELSRIETENNVKVERLQAIKEQIDYVNNKPEEDSRQMTGTMFMIKSGSSNREKLVNFTSNGQLCDKNCHENNFDDILTYKFDMKTFVDEANVTTSINVGDNSKLIFDESSMVGFHEIKYSFLASYGVDPKLIRTEWLENAYKMIFMKFLWMENCLEKIDKFVVLTPENLLLQLKYRYDRELDRHQRPALRKITETDETSTRRIVLKVVNIIYSLDVGYELELSDGWYKMRTCVDSCIAEAIANKKILLNTKLITCNAELINVFSSGYHPLDLPHGVRLKIHGNSTRIARWDAKLGFQKNVGTFLVSLDSVSNEGGVIGRLRVCIVHVYSLIYVESKGEKKEFRSEKMQNRLDNQKEILYSTIYEQIQQQIVKETYNELNARVSKIDKSRIVLSKMSIYEIADLLEYESENDLAYVIKSQLSLAQMEKISEIYSQRKFELHQKIKDKISKSENNVAQLLKFRVVDARNPKKTALVSWWRPSEELLGTIKIGNVIEIQKTSSAGKFQAMCGGELQIHADKATVVRQLPKAVNFEKFKEFIRVETKFREVTRDFGPLNNEFDIACVIVFVDEKRADEKFQKVYVADENAKLFVLNFYPCISECAYDDVLVEGKLLYIRNLQWRRGFKNNNEELPEAYTIMDSTIFISNPRDDAQRMRLKELGDAIGDDFGEFLRNCREKLENLTGISCSKAKNEGILRNIQLNVQPSTSSRTRSSNRVLGMRRIPQKYRFS